MTSSTNNRSIFSELLRRRVLQILAIYGAGCWTVVQIVEWIIDRYLISPHLTDLCLIGMLSFIPSIALIAYFHGTPGRDKWHPIEKIGIPINIIASVLILFITFYPKDLGAITETIIVEDELGNTVERVIPKAEFRKKITIFNFRNLSKVDDDEWLKIGLSFGIEYDLVDELITDIHLGNHHYLAYEKNYKENDELPLNLMLDIAKQNKTKYLLFGNYTVDDSIYLVNTYLYDSNASKLLKERSYRNIELFTIIDHISSDLKIDVEISLQYLKDSKDLPFSEICTKSIDAYRELCKASYCRNEDLYIEADKHLNRALEYDKQFSYAYQILLWNGWALNKELDQIEYYSNMSLNTMHNMPGNYQRDIKLTHAQLIEKDYNKAIMILEMNLKLNPNELNSRNRLVWIYKHKLEYSKAINEIENLYTLDPDAKYLRNFANIYQTDRKYNKVLEYAVEYMDKYPDDDLGYLFASTAYRGLGDINKAKDYLNQCLLVDPEFLWAECKIDYYGYLLHEISFDKLINKYHNKINRSQTDENKSFLYEWLANIYSVHGLIDSAIYNLNIGLKLNEENRSPASNTWRNLKFIPFYLNMGRENIAHDVYDQYGDIGSRKEYDFSRAWIYLYKHKYEEAKNMTDNIIIKLKDEGNLLPLGKYYFLKGIIYLQSKEYQNAITAFLKALDYPESYPHYYLLSAALDNDIYLLLSQSYYELGDMISAKEWIEKAYQLNSFEPRIRYQMALIEHDVGNHEKAMQYLEYCLDTWKHADVDFLPSVEAKQKLAEWNQVN